MKITPNKNSDLRAVSASKIQNPLPKSDLFPRPTFRRPRRKSGVSGGGVRLRRDGAPRSRPEAPVLRGKFENGGGRNKEVVLVNGDVVSPENGRESCRKVSGGGDRGGCVSVSARKLAADLWRLQPPEVCTNVGLGFKSAAGPSGIQSLDHIHRHRKSFESRAKELGQSPHSVSAGPKNGFLNKLEPSFHISNSAMEGATKWDPYCWKASEEVKRIYGHTKHIEQQVGVVSRISVLESELEQARDRVHELETERRSSKKKLEHFLKKLNEEKLAWRSREHEKIRAIINDVKGELSREKKNRQRMEIVNSKLVNELADAKASAKRFMQDYEKERKARALIEEVCDELAKEIGEDKAEVEALKRESMKMREELEDEKRMLQMAEVWREERVQMKLVDAKVTLEDKFSQMNMLLASLETFLSSKGVTLDDEEMRKAEAIRKAASTISIQEMREFTYERPNPDDIFSVFEDVNFGETNMREIEPSTVYSPVSHASKVHTVSPEVCFFKKDGIQRHSNAYFDPNGDMEEDDDDDESGWETVSHLEDQGSSYSPNGSDPSVCNSHRISQSRPKWEENGCNETPATEISEVCLVQPRRSKKVSSISRLWRSSNGENYKIISVEGMNNGRLSSAAVFSPDKGSAKGGRSPPGLAEQWSSPESGDPHGTRGMKGCIDWPRAMQKGSLKAKLLEARMESQKIQLRQVLKQKI